MICLLENRLNRWKNIHVNADILDITLRAGGHWPGKNGTKKNNVYANAAFQDVNIRDDDDD